MSFQIKGPLEGEEVAALFLGLQRFRPGGEGACGEEAGGSGGKKMEAARRQVGVTLSYLFASLRRAWERCGFSKYLFLAHECFGVQISFAQNDILDFTIHEAGVYAATKASLLDRKPTSTEICHRISETPIGGYAQHLESRKHAMQASHMSEQIIDFTMIKPRIDDKSTSNGGISNFGTGKITELAEEKKFDVLCCFVCDRKHADMENYMVHLRISHGLFIPDAEYLIDPIGLLTYINIKVKKEFTCLFCNERCHPFRSLEAVRKHMIDKWHCKLRYGDGADDEEGELEDFFDYSSSYLDEAGNQLVPAELTIPRIELGIGGAELIITRKTDNRTIVRTLGHRTFHLYYRQKPRPSQNSYITDAILKASRCQSKRVVTVQPKGNFIKMKTLKEMNHHTKLRMKNRELPKRKY